MQNLGAKWAQNSGFGAQIEGWLVSKGSNTLRLPNVSPDVTLG
jgi:hypothetical protein